MKPKDETVTQHLGGSTSDKDKPCAPAKNPTHLGEEGTEQFVVRTYLNDRQIGEQKIHDPFARTTVRICLWDRVRGLFAGLKVQVCIDGSQGAKRAIMTLNPYRLAMETEEILQSRLHNRSVAATSDIVLSDVEPPDVAGGIKNA